MNDFPVGPGKKEKTPSQKAPGEKNETDQDLVLTPGGPRPRKLVKVVPPGEAVRATEDGVRVVPVTESDSAKTQEKKEHE
jgi:hypothetical protein